MNITTITGLPKMQEFFMIYLIEIEEGTGKLEVRQYDGLTLWDVVADAEADITGSPGSRIKRVWPLSEALTEIRVAALPH